MSRAILSSLAAVLVGAICFQAAGQKPPSSAVPADASAQRALLDRYCVTCHNEKLKTADLVLDKVDLSKIGDAAPVWEKVVRKLRTRAMPPAGVPRPDDEGYNSFATYLETALDRAAAASANPGRPTIHRLNRTEYINAVRDLLALDVNGESLIPADDSGYGFDNNADVLSASPLLLDRYMSAARLISRLAIGDPTIRLPISTYEVPRFGWQNDRVSEDLPFGSRGGIAIRHYFPLDGEYLLRIRLQYFDKDSITELSEPHQLDVRLDNARVKMFTIGGSQENSKPAEYGDLGIEVRFAAKAGRHLVGVAFRDERSLSEGMLRPPFVQLEHDGQGPKIDGKSAPAVDSVDIAGPYDAKRVTETPSRRKIFVCRPSGPKDEDLCAKKVLLTLARRAYRRPIADADIQGLFGLYQSGRSAGFETGIGRAIQGILLSREFLFRDERDPANVTPGSAHRISDLELASRLSFFLWSSIPDDQLLGLAEQGKLKDPEVLEQQVRRMLVDSRSKALMDNFGGQWLNLRNIHGVGPDLGAFPAFDEDLRTAFEREMELFLDSNLREDRSMMDLLNANYTFVNERLARHYGIPNIYGSRFRRITLTDENRWGLLGKGAILMVTSFPNRTSPVTRGKWVLENVLGTPPPPPPANVPALDIPAFGPERITMRQRMEQHRANPACAGCHARMDPLGFALENFNGIGQWRTAVAGAPIDVSGVLPDGTKFQGPAELRKILASHPDEFVTTVTEKLLTYALGRGVEYYDEPAIRGILREAASKDYRWSAFILGIAKSAPFQMRRATERSVTAGVR